MAWAIQGRALGQAEGGVGFPAPSASDVRGLAGSFVPCPPPPRLGILSLCYKVIRLSGVSSGDGLSHPLPLKNLELKIPGNESGTFCRPLGFGPSSSSVIGLQAVMCWTLCVSVCAGLGLW